jgi:hypothetical protein
MLCKTVNEIEGSLVWWLAPVPVPDADADLM